MGKGSEATVSLGGVRCDLTQPVRSWALLGGREGWATRVHSDPPPFLLHSQQKTELPVTENVQTIPPPYVVRTILVYSRPPCQPQLLPEYQSNLPGKEASPEQRGGFFSLCLLVLSAVPGGRLVNGPRVG